MTRPHPRVLFVGSKAFGLSLLEGLHRLAPDNLVGIVTIDDTGDTRSALGEFRAFASSHAIPFSVASDRAHSEQLFLSVAPDLCFVAGWYWLIKTATLNAVPNGFVGIHNSLLPKYRGSSPLVWSIINGDTEAGFSLFTLGPGVDEGPIWASGTVPIGPDDTVGDVLGRLEHAVRAALVRVYPDMLRSVLRPIPQAEHGISYCAARLPEDGRIEWRQPALAVHNFIRAQTHPYPGAFTILGDQRLTVWRAGLFDAPYLGMPGQVARVGPDGVCVVCGDNRAVVLQEVEWNGARGKASSILRSTSIRLPDRSRR